MPSIFFKCGKLMNAKSARIALSSLIAVFLLLASCGKEANAQVDLATNNVGQITNATPAHTQEQRELLELRQKADKGDPAAEFALGKRYETGSGVESNLTEAANWFRKAAEQGHAHAQFFLSFYYLAGTGGVESNLCEAVKWCRKAAEQGFSDAQTGLGSCYAQGWCVQSNQNEAVKWYRKAAEQGELSGVISLGKCYVNGDGVPKDLVEAYKWFDIAARKGILPGDWLDWRERLALSMTPAQLAEAQRRSSEFVPKKEGTNPTDSPAQPYIDDRLNR
jgi:TPR repeat protein